MKRIRTMKVNRMTMAIQKRLEAFGFTIVTITVSDGYAIIRYK
jgi:hypothetical protein